jgi:uncharacterized protein YcbK (DUF882 family)
MAIQSLHCTAVRRRAVLKALAFAPLGRVLAGSPSAAAAQERALAFHHTHTGERLQVVYYAPGGYVADALASVDRLLRDFRTGEQHSIDPRLLDTLCALRLAFGGGTFEIISGYRSPRTNAMLRRASTGVAENSLHTTGRAIDVRLVGTATTRLRDAAIALGHGGVGYYPESDFIHLDTGRVRTWGPRAA